MLVIAHQMRTVEAADKVVVLAEGQVAEEGSPAELMAKEAAYTAGWWSCSGRAPGGGWSKRYAKRGGLGGYRKTPGPLFPCLGTGDSFFI